MLCPHPNKTSKSGSFFRTLPQWTRRRFQTRRSRLYKRKKHEAMFTAINIHCLATLNFSSDHLFPIRDAQRAQRAQENQQNQAHVRLFEANGHFKPQNSRTADLVEGQSRTTVCGAETRYSLNSAPNESFHDQRVSRQRQGLVRSGEHHARHPFAR